MSSYQVYITGGDMEVDASDGFRQVLSIKENIKQNLKMLLLVSPGELPGAPSLGVGIKRYLFEIQEESVYASIDSKIREQVSNWMPYLQIQGVEFTKSENNESRINLKLTYSVPGVVTREELNVPGN